MLSLKTDMHWVTGVGRGRLLILLATLGFAVSAVVIVRNIWFVLPDRVTMSAGNTEGLWHRFLVKFAPAAKDYLRIKPVVTAGTLDMLDRVDRGELDFALVQGGYDIERFEHVRQVAAMSVLPIHLLVKSEHHKACARRPHQSAR